MSPYYYKFPWLKSLGYQLAWNCLLERHTLEHTVDPNKLEVMWKQIELLQQAGCDPNGAVEGAIHFCFMAFAFAECEVLPAVAHPDARWYLILSPFFALENTRDRLDRDFLSVQQDVRRKYGVYISLE